MEEIKLLTVKDLAKRWQCSERAIREYVADGVIAQCKGVPGVKFHPRHIEKLEGVEFDKFSPLERRRLEKKIQELNELVELQSEQLRKIAMLGTESLSVLQRCI